MKLANTAIIGVLITATSIAQAEVSNKQVVPTELYVPQAVQKPIQQSTVVMYSVVQAKPRPTQIYVPQAVIKPVQETEIVMKSVIQSNR